MRERVTWGNQRHGSGAATRRLAEGSKVLAFKLKGHVALTLQYNVAQLLVVDEN